MEDQARTRLDLLRQEFESGQRQLADLDGRRAQLTETMLRISGAIQVLEEMLGERPLEHAPAGNGTELEAAERAAAG